MKTILTLVLLFAAIVTPAASFEVRNSPDQSQYALFVPGRTVFVAKFELVTGSEDLYGDSVIGGNFGFSSHVSDTNNWFQHVWSTDMTGNNGQYGDRGYAFRLPTGVVEGGWLSDTNTIFPRNTTNAVYVSLGLDYETDWHANDTIIFTSSDFCRMKDGNGNVVYATGTVSNTITLIVDSRLEISKSSDAFSFRAFVPSRYNGYELQGSSDLTTWTSVPGTANLERTIMAGEFRFILPYSNNVPVKFFRLREQH